MHDILPDDFRLSDSYATMHTTIEDALSHRSGLAAHTLAYGWEDSRMLTRLMRLLPITQELRTGFQYCNLMYTAVSHMLERVTNRDLGDILHKWFWEPLNMQSTFLLSRKSVDKISGNSARLLARGYHWAESFSEKPCNNIEEARTGFYVPEPYPNLVGLAGAGAVISSVSDYALWLSALLSAASANGASKTSVLDKHLYRQLMTPRTISPPSFLSYADSNNSFATPPTYALGWITSIWHGRVMISHPGSLTGFGTEIYLFPDDGLGIVTMANTQVTSNTVGRLAAFRIAEKRLGVLHKTVQEVEFHDTANCNTRRDLPQVDLDSYSRARSHSQAAQTAPGSQVIISASDSSESRILPSFTGRYNSKGYGEIKIEASKEEPTRLLVKPSLKVWPYELCLHEVIGNPGDGYWFDAEIWKPHGPYIKDALFDNLPTCQIETSQERDVSSESKQDIICKDKIVWTRSAEKRQAFFDLDHNGRAARFGIELEPEMVRVRDEKRVNGEKFDELDAMIWFGRVSPSLT